jgi:hypothetical protein
MHADTTLGMPSYLRVVSMVYMYAWYMCGETKGNGNDRKV